MTDLARYPDLNASNDLYTTVAESVTIHWSMTNVNIKRNQICNVTKPFGGDDGF